MVMGETSLIHYDNHAKENQWMCEIIIIRKIFKKSETCQEWESNPYLIFMNYLLRVTPLPFGHPDLRFKIIYSNN